MRSRRNLVLRLAPVFFGALFALLAWIASPHIYTSPLSWLVAIGTFWLQLSALHSPRLWPMQLPAAARQSTAVRLLQWFLQWWLSPAMILMAFSIIGVFNFPWSLGSALLMTLLPSLMYLGLYVDTRYLTVGR